MCAKVSRRESVFPRRRLPPCCFFGRAWTYFVELFWAGHTTFLGKGRLNTHAHPQVDLGKILDMVANLKG